MLNHAEAPSDPGLNYVFGWASFTYDGATLSLVDSAGEDAGVGIIAGQHQVVPEPSTVLLFGIGVLGVWMLRRSKKLSPQTLFSKHRKNHLKIGIVGSKV